MTNNVLVRKTSGKRLTFDAWVLRDEEYERWLRSGDFNSSIGEMCWHRVGKPALYYTTSNIVQWWVYNRRYVVTIRYCEACGFDEETTLMWFLKYGEELPGTWDHNDFLSE